LWLALGEHQRLFLFGQDLELFLLFSDLHRQLLGMLAGSLSAAVLSAHPHWADASSIDPQPGSEVKGCSAASRIWLVGLDLK
jgi:hypothetical protein